MPKVESSFPDKIWDGSSVSRSAPVDSYDKSPDFQDWDRMTAEVISMQEDLRNLDASNIKPLEDYACIPVMYKINIEDITKDTDIIVKQNLKIVDATVIKISANGGPGDSVILKNGDSSITNVMSLNVNNQLIVRPSLINDTTNEIKQGGILRITTSKSTSVACVICIWGYISP